MHGNSMHEESYTLTSLSDLVALTKVFSFENAQWILCDLHNDKYIMYNLYTYLILKKNWLNND